MKTLLKSKYHVVIVSFYVLFCVYFFFFTKLSQALSSYSYKDLAILFPLVVVSLGMFFAVNYFLKFGIVGLNRDNLSKLPAIVLYATLLIAVPEEILFRGLAQTYLSSLFPSVIISIVLSSALFGLAHVLNGVKGFGPRSWNWKLVAMTFTAGVFLGFSFYVTSSLVVPIILHTLFIIMMKIFIKDTV